jgi:hypothetical protein
MKSYLNFREKTELAEKLKQLINTTPESKNCGWEELPLILNEIHGTEYSVTNCRTVAIALGLDSYFKASQSRKERIDTRVSHLEEQLAAVTQRLEICERKWLQHLQGHTAPATEQNP